jgi:hypothetical protein
MFHTTIDIKLNILGYNFIFVIYQIYALFYYIKIVTAKILKNKKSSLNFSLLK